MVLLLHQYCHSLNICSVNFVRFCKIHHVEPKDQTFKRKFGMRFFFVLIYFKIYSFGGGGSQFHRHRMLLEVNCGPTLPNIFSDVFNMSRTRGYSFVDFVGFLLALGLCEPP